ncbi:hypothetical protein, conserved [Leishmania tarentolae]|uniref:Amastin-like protein n=1 Tax=Leishmania tarentolae TaxID=5689 RepID=A0A640KK09_LEITA|nr:hypothetical protein, conserved [Leishmania tarentolae]
MAMKGQGNNVPQRYQPGQLDSDDESYTGSSSSYSEMASEASPHRPQPAAAAAAVTQLPPKTEQDRRASGLQQMPSSVKQEKTAQKKDPVERGKANARTMMNAVFEAPMARMRAVAGAVSSSDNQRVTIYIFFCIAWVHLIFVILSSTLSQIDVVGGSCYTFWGYKLNCDTVSYTRRTALLQNCSRLRRTIQAGAAFSIFSILASTATWVASWVLCCRFREATGDARVQNAYVNVDAMAFAQEPTTNDRIENGNQANTTVYDAGYLKKVIALIVAFSLFCELICWTLIASIMKAHYCDNIYLWSTTATYGVGFGLGLTAWLVELIVFIVFMIVV